MRRIHTILVILAAGLMLLAGCTLNLVDGPVPETSKSDIKVPITLDVRIPTDGISTKAMADDPQVRNMVVVVFGGSGYFNGFP